MSKSEVLKISSNNSLVKVGNLISLTNKLLNGSHGKAIVLYNLSEYHYQQKAEAAFLNLIKKNIWLFISKIIDQIISDKLSANPYPLDFFMNIEKHDLPYEYPRSFYRSRGSGVTLVDKEYDRKINEGNEQYILCSPPMDGEFKNIAFANITTRIAGAIITEYADTSIGVVLGIKYRWSNNG